MRLLIQRVSQASVIVEETVVGEIKKGLLVFLGIHQSDTADLIPYLSSKLVSLRIFEDEKEKMNLSLKDKEGSLLIVSQFTLYGNCLSGRRPDFTQAADPSRAKVLYDSFIEACKKEIPHVAQGVFGAHMKVELINDGPVTFILEKENRSHIHAS